MNFQGVFAIPCTPFTDTGELDEASLRREIRFTHACGAHGIVAPVNASEFYTLADDERKRVVEIVAEENAGRIPFIAGCTAVSTAHAVMLATHAQSAGADAIMAMPPVIRKSSEREIEHYYGAIDLAIDIPIVLQDFIPPMGTPMSLDLMARLVQELEHVRYIKEETQFGPHVISSLVARCGDRLSGVMGGQGGRHLWNELARGTCGTMPACHAADVLVDIWNMHAAGDEVGARALFDRLLPLLNFEAMYAVSAYKEVLRRRGVLATAFCRGGTVPLDEVDHRELDRILGDLDPILRVKDPD